jgi:hypothetical protein
VLNGVTAQNPTHGMLKSLKQKLGSAINDYDTSVIYMLDNIDVGASFTNANIPAVGRFKSMLLFIRPRDETAK